MSNIGDLLKTLGADDSSAIDVAGNLLGTLADLSGGIGFIQLFTSLIQPTDNQVQQALTAIQSTIDSDFRQLQGDIAAEGILAKERDIDAGINPEAAVFALLPSIVSDLATLPDSFILTQLETCFAAVQFFTDYDDKWVIPWASLPQYADDWSGAIIPPQSPFVFNYTYVLPQFLRALYMFQTVLLALRPDALTHVDVQALLGKCLIKLQTVHNTMTAGIVGTKIPTVGDVADIDVSQDLQRWRAAWYGGPLQPIMSFWNSSDLWPFGAVEIYSGLDNIQSYTVFEPYEYLPPPDRAPLQQAFVDLVQLRVEERKKAMYKQLGLPAVRSVINHLRRLTGQPALTARAYETLSIKDAASVMGILPSAAPTEFWSSLMALLGQVPPYDGGLLFPAEAQGSYSPTPLPTSFLSLFTHVTA